MSRAQSLNVLRLIAEVRARRPLWDRAYTMNCQRNQLDVLWNEVAAILCAPVYRVKSKWKNMKDFFRRETKRTVAEPLYRPRWRLYKPLLFLKDDQSKPELIEIEDHGTGQPSAELEPDHVEMKIEYEYSEVPSAPDYEDESESKIDPQALEYEDGTTSFDPLANSHQPATDDPDAYDPDLCFFRSLLPHIKELSPQKRMQLRIKIHDLVYKEIYTFRVTDKKN